MGPAPQRWGQKRLQNRLVSSGFAPLESKPRAGGSGILQGSGSHFRRLAYELLRQQSMTYSLRIIVADDDPEMLRYYARIIPELGHCVVASVPTAGQLIEACHEYQPDVLITGVNLRSEAGLDILESCHFPFIVVTADDEPDCLPRPPAGRMIAYLQKPVGRRDFAECLARAELQARKS